MIEDILIADDSSTARMITRRCMEIAGYQNANFHEASDGVEALKFANKQHIDLFIIDLNMPEMDGLTLLKHLHEDEKLCKIPVLVISSLLSEEKEHKLRKYGAFAYLSKPISPAGLLKVMQKLTEKTGWGV